MQKILRSHDSSQRHRLSVVLPLLLLLGSLTIREGLNNAQGKGGSDIREEIVTQAQASAVVFPSGLGANVFPQSRIVRQREEIALERGSAIIASRGTSVLTVGSLAVQSWHGAYHVTRRGSGIVVAALSSPVLVTARSRHVLIPVGMQWMGTDDIPSLGKGVDSWGRARVVKPLPPHYLRSYLPLASKLFSDIPLAAVTQDSALPTPFSDLLRLPSARKRSRESQAADVLSIVMASLLQGEKERVTDFFRREDAAEVLGKDRDRASTLLALAEALEQEQLFLQSFLTGEEAVLIGSLHPSIRDRVWVSPATLGDEEASLLRLLMLPLSDTQASAVHPLAIEKWGDELSRVLAEAHHPELLVSFLLKSFAAQARHLRQEGLIDRSKRYAHMVAERLQPYASLFSRDDLVLLARLERDAPSPPVAPPAEHRRAEHAEVLAASVSSQEVEEAREILLRAGGMFMVTTALEPGVGVVNVQDLVLSSSHGDRPFTFDFDPYTGRVSGVMIEGKRLPYALSLAKFLQWVREGVGR